MTLMDVAQMLGADARYLERMAGRGQIPCQKVRGQFRFNRAELTQWLQQNIATMDRDNLAAVDAGMTVHRQTRRRESIVTPLLRGDAVTAHLSSRTKSSTLRQLVSLAERTSLVYDAEALLEAVLQREELGSTAMPGGIAIPHPHGPLPYAIAEPIVVVARAPHGIVFGAPDGRLTELFFLTASQDDHHHVHVLARLCRMLQDEAFVEELAVADTPAEIAELVQRREQQLISQSV
jgi:PTS system nitrogen regulatory IIA component